MTLIEATSALHIGSVEFVAPDEIKVALDVEAPQATALNAGVPARFPRINGYLLIPNEMGALVGMVTWVGIERSSFPKRTGMRDFGLVDLPFPHRMLSLNPVGTLRGHAEEGLELERGVFVFPSVGDPVLLATREQVQSIVEASGRNRRVWIGGSPLAPGARVTVDPDKMFGRHLAVLGNTGSGKSCTVAGLIRWSLEASTVDGKPPNARFIVLEPNGEYRAAMSDISGVRFFEAPILGTEPEKEGAARLEVPAYFWNGQEWAAFARAASGVQRPVLSQALRSLRGGGIPTDDPEQALSARLGSYRAWFDALLAQGPSYYGGSPRGRFEAAGLLEALRDDASDAAGRVAGHEESLTALADSAESTRLARARQVGSNTFYDPFRAVDLEPVRQQLSTEIESLPMVALEPAASEDAPTAFDVSQLPDFIDLLANSSTFANAAQYVPPLVARIRGMLTDPRLAPIVNPSSREGIESWLERLLGSNQDAESRSSVAVLDLSLVPSDVLHLIIAVIARLVFEASQRYRKLTGDELPTVIVLEEAHTFVKRSSDSEDDPAGRLCREVFERIAREGRKFGVGLVLASQRPSELSPTVLAQCNTYMLHRIVNDRDQDLVARLVPDKLAGLLRELPSLPSRQAIVVGWSVALPTLTEIRELPVGQRPRSADPRYWDVWRGEVERALDWRAIAEDWTGTTPAATDEPPTS